MRKEHAIPPAERLGTLEADVGLALGTPIPDVTVQDAQGRDVSLAALAETGPLLLVFYRGGWCPFCNFQIHELTQAHHDFKRRGVTPVAISVDRVEEAAKTQATYEIPFPLLSDPDLVAHRAFRVTHEVGSEEFERLKGFGLDIEAASGRDHHVIAVPSVFIIDRTGVVRWAHTDSDYKVRPSTAQILEVIDGLDLSDGR